MGKPLNEPFFEWLKKGGKSMIEMLMQYQDLDLRMNGDKLKIYFKGFLILTIPQSIIKKIEFVFSKTSLLNPSYYQNKPNNSLILDVIRRGVRIHNLQEYIETSIGFLSARDNSRIEETIRQEIAMTNNRSRVANETDYFIVDQEYKFFNGDDSPRFDLVAIKWPSTGESHKNFDLDNNIGITVFELKYGKGAIGGSKASSDESENNNTKADMVKHVNDFYNFKANKELVETFKENILRMFIQQASLKGLYNPTTTQAMKNVVKLSDPVNSMKLEEIKKGIPINFGFINADFKEKSLTLKLQVDKIDKDFIFAKASFMGYGLFEKSMMSKQELISFLNENHDS